MQKQNSLESLFAPKLVLILQLNIHTYYTLFDFLIHHKFHYDQLILNVGTSFFGKCVLKDLHKIWEAYTTRLI